MIVVDSSVWIANLRGLDTIPVRKLKVIEDMNEILVGDLVLLEVLQGARNERHALQIERNLRQFSIEPMLDDAIAVQTARNYRLLREAGHTPRKTIDMIIGTFCIQNGHRLLHDDRDFEPLTRILGLQTL
ncbi:type II toxin-antitoxin system VapC family toxin [Pararhizobium sp. O133]|uniref:type II toxin-antitoxin system VapC family toxin n=1 Tax=Pararhizobium sp. O133 TaxID=3449278 RepID=UPI003F6868EE